MHWYVIEILYRFYKKVFVVPKYPSPLRPYPFCVCFTVFYILNRQTEWNEYESGLFFFNWDGTKKGELTVYCVTKQVISKIIQRL